MDTTDTYKSRLPQDTSDDSPYLSSDLSKAAISSQSEPPPSGENGGLRCTVLYLPGPRKRISEDSLRRRISNFPLMDSWEIHYYGVLQSFRLGPLGIAHALDFLLLFICAWVILFFKRGAVEGWSSLSLFFFCCMCATVVYPQPTQGSCMYEGQPG